MGFAKLSDELWRNSKLFYTGDRAFRLYIRSISYVNSTNSDGLITQADAKILGAKPAVINELVERRLWEIVDEGWYIHDYKEHNTTAAQRAEKAEQSRAAAQARWKRGEPRGQQPLMPPSETHAKRNAPRMLNAMRPAMRNHAYTDTDTDTDAYVDAVASTAPAPLDDEPQAVREIASTVLSRLPQKHQRDDRAIEEILVFARQFADQSANVAIALEACLRDNQIPFARNLRPRMPGWSPTDADRNGNRKSLTPEQREFNARLERRNSAGAAG